MFESVCKCTYFISFLQVFGQVLSSSGRKNDNFFGGSADLHYLCRQYIRFLKHKNKYGMAKMKGAIVVDTERCKGCQLCIIACPQKVIALANKVNLHGYPYVEAVNEAACVGCASCGIVCPDGCITVYRKKMED